MDFFSLGNYGILIWEINEYLILRIHFQLFIENGLLIGKIKITKNVVIDFNLQILLKFKNENHF